MSAYNAGAILQGLNNGVVDAWKFGIQQDRIDRQEARQAEIDRRAAEAHDLNMRARQLEFDEVNRQVTERQGARQAATPQKAENGFAVGQQGSQNFYKDEATARAAAEDQAFIDGADAPQAPRQATALTGGGKPQIGAFGMKADNSRIGTAKRVADYWRSLGETDKADQIEMQAKETDRKFYDAAREEIWRNALMASKDGPQAFVDALYKSYNDGFDARVVPGPNGGGRVERIGPDGKPAGAIDFRNMDDLAAKAYQLVFPDRAYAARVQSQAEIAKERAKGVKLSPGEQQYGYDADGKLVPLASNDNMSPTEKAALIRAGGSSGNGSTGKGGKATDPIAAAAEAVMDQATKGEIKLQPNQISDAQLRAAQIAARGVPLYVAANVALKVAQDPSLLKPRVNPQTGTIDNVYEDTALGEVVVDREIASARSPKNLKSEDLQGFAKKVVESLSPESRRDVVAAAFDGKARGKVEQDLRAKITAQFEEQIAKNPNARQQIEAQRDAYIKSSMDALGRKLDLINGHYPKPTEDKPAQRRSWLGGQSGGQAYVPPADSPAGRARARDEAIMRERAGKEEAWKARAPEVSSRVKQIVASKDLAAASQLQGSKEFDLLSREEKLEIFKLVNGIQR